MSRNRSLAVSSRNLKSSATIASVNVAWCLAPSWLVSGPSPVVTSFSLQTGHQADDETPNRSRFSSSFTMTVTRHIFQAEDITTRASTTGMPTGILRLYELMCCAIPSHNWLPGGSRPIEESDWGTEKMNRRLKRIQRWHSWFQQVCYSEMISHQFLNDERTLQRIEFDVAEGNFRVDGVPGFSGEWERPEVIDS